MRSRGTLRLAGTWQGADREFSARSSSGRVPGENASRQQEQTPVNSESFDSVNGPASESIRYAQDDSVGKVGDGQECPSHMCYPFTASR